MGALDILQEVRLARSKSVLDHLNTEDLEEAIRRLTNRMEHIQVLPETSSQAVVV
jgi:predicted metal-dependent TIM-barrel fold hydrolase